MTSTGDGGGARTGGRAARTLSDTACEELTSKAPETVDELHRVVEELAGVSVGRSALEPGHAAPMDYLEHVFFERGAEGGGAGGADCLVWASRGSGKTFLAAVATLLDLVYKPGVQVRLLGGSLEQSQRMYEHLRTLLESDLVSGMVVGRPTVKGVRLNNGSGAQVLAASQTAVRGTRVQKVRCDEVDLFDPEVWEAAQLTTRSMVCDKGPWRKTVRGTVEGLSTMHVPFGLMQRLVSAAGPAGGGGRRVFKWGVLDVLERCEPERDCAACGLHAECAGRAKADGRLGHVRVDDALAMKSRVGLHVWRGEMLCVEPMRSDRVYAEFSRERHVLGDAGVAGLGAFKRLVAGMDFGFRSESALLLGGVDGLGRLVVLRERVEAGVLVSEMARALRAWADEAAATGGPALELLAIDPAGRARSDQTGRSAAEVLAEAGLPVRSHGSTIQEGVSLVRARLTPASGPARLLVHERCGRLIESLGTYHYSPDDPESVEPVKDGSDHACDALRYLVHALDAGGRVEVRGY
jgi:hypothetical protein